LFKTDVMDDLFNYFNPATQAVSPMISAETHDVIKRNADRLNSAIIYDRDYGFNYFGFKVPAAVVVFHVRDVKIRDAFIPQLDFVE